MDFLEKVIELIDSLCRYFWVIALTIFAIVGMIALFEISSTLGFGALIAILIIASFAYYMN